MKQLFLFLTWHHIYYQCLVNKIIFLKSLVSGPTPQHLKERHNKRLYKKSTWILVKIIRLLLSLQTICDPSKPNILSTSCAKFRIQLMFIFIDIQLISVKRLWDHCAYLFGQVRHNNFQSKLMYFTTNNTTWIKKCVFGIQTLHHTFYYQCLI
jgi:hypothetical protein